MTNQVEFGCPTCWTILNAKAAGGCIDPWHFDNRALDALFAGINTRAPDPPKPLDLDEMYRLADQITASRPEWDRIVVAPDVLDGLPRAEAPPLGGGIGDLLGTPVHVDHTLAPGSWELRDGDRVVKRGIPAEWLGPGEMLVIDVDALEQAFVFHGADEQRKATDPAATTGVTAKNINSEEAP